MPLLGRAGCQTFLSLQLSSPLLEKPSLDTDSPASYCPISNLLFWGMITECKVQGLPNSSRHMWMPLASWTCQSSFQPRYSTQTVLVALVNDLCLEIDLCLCNLEFRLLQCTLHKAALEDHPEAANGSECGGLPWAWATRSTKLQCSRVHTGSHCFPDTIQGAELGP